MALANKARAGTLPAAIAALYTAAAPGAFTVNITNLGVAVTCNVYVNHAGTRSRITAMDFNLPLKSAWPPNAPYGPIFLDTGDSIDGDASAAGAVSWLITGVER